MAIPERVRKMIDAYESGLTLEEVGKAHGVPGWRIASIFAKHGHARRPSGTRHTDDALLNHLRELSGRLGHTATQTDLYAHDGPGPRAYKRFSSLRRAQELAGLPPNQRSRPAMAHA